MLALLTSAASAFSIQRPPPPCVAPRCASARAEGPPPLVPPLTDAIWDMSPPVRVEGDSLRTWDIGTETTERVQVSLRSQGRPLEASVELWHTPSYKPIKFKVECEDGNESPVHVILETPKHPKTIAVFNTESQDFPFEASVAPTGLGVAYDSLADSQPDVVQGGKVTSYIFGPEVESIQVLLKTDKRNMKAIIEIIQGPNDDNQTFELEATEGCDTPFYTVIQTPGEANTLRIINENTVEFPFAAYVLPYTYDTNSGSEPEVVMGSL